jgi:O-acetyl-ADP-ribose deacetylase (regulator of RNase III)
MVTYVKGDATKPIGDGPKIIAHITNDDGGWGAGFTGALDRAFGPGPQMKYRAEYDYWTKTQGLLFMPLGTISRARVNGYRDAPDTPHEERSVTLVYNMTAQHRTIRHVEKPVCYKSIEHCLISVAAKAFEIGATVHMPRIGCGLAGGDWNVVESIINRTLTLRDIDVTVYDL